jgi:SM-20-related protein
MYLLQTIFSCELCLPYCQMSVLCPDNPQAKQLEDEFNALINTFLEEQVGVADHFLNETLAAQLQENLQQLYAQKQLYSAGIGQDTELIQNALIRKDVIYWLDRNHGNAVENQFLDLIDLFVDFLNNTCYTGITGYEFHYALYEKGSFYKKHLDQFRNNKSRAFSMIMYLNPDWELAHGGQLCVYLADQVQMIDPLSGKCVFFKSGDLEHEVLMAHAPRMSITGWLKTNTYL